MLREGLKVRLGNRALLPRLAALDGPGLVVIYFDDSSSFACASSWFTMVRSNPI